MELSFTIDKYVTMAKLFTMDKTMVLWTKI